MKPERMIAKQVVKIGFSPFLILATDSVIIIALNAVLQYYGGEEMGDTLITAATIVQSYMLLVTAPMLGVTSGSQPLISFNYGANKPERIRKTVACVLGLCIGFTVLMFGSPGFFRCILSGSLHRMRNISSLRCGESVCSC